MKGVIFNITEFYISETFGEETLERIMESSVLATKDPYIGPGTYPDSDLLEIVTKAAQYLNISVEQFLKDLGRFSFLQLQSRFPDFVTGFVHPKDFLKTVDGIIHVEVRKLYSDTILPTFTYADPAADELIITYYSPRKLYPFMEGLINGVGDFYSHHIEQSKNIYLKEDKEFCDFHLKFTPWVTV